MSIDTKTVTGRRELHFVSLDDIGRDVDRLAAIQVTTLGNWSFGQVLQHLTTAMNASIEGTSIKVPFYLRLIGPLMKRRMLTRAMPSGFQMPQGMAQVLAPAEPESIPAAVAAIHAAIERLKTEQTRRPHPIIGRLTQEEWDQLHLRHAEMHLSFVVPT